MNVFQTAEDLVNERLEMGVGKRLAGTNDGSKIALHQLCGSQTVSAHRLETKGTDNSVVATYPHKDMSR